MSLNSAFCSALILATVLATTLGLPAWADAPVRAPLQIAQGENEIDDWNAIKDSKKAEDYQAYLDKYPNGNFADLAKLRIKKYAPAEPAPAAAPAAAPADPQQQDLADWNAIKASKNADDYKAYLEKYPDGLFVDVAKVRIEQYGAAAAAPAPVEAPAAQAAEPAAVEPPAGPVPAALTFSAANATLYAKGGGQVRAEPDAKAALVTKLKTNTEVKATGLSSDGNWYRVEVAGQSGYMHRTVVSEKPVTVAKPSSKKAEPAAPEATGPDEDLCKLGSAASPNGRVSACERLLAKAGDDKAEIAALGNLAAALNKATRRDEAIRKYEQAAALAPRDPSIYTRIGLVRLEQRRFPEARAAFEKAAQLDNQDSDIVFYRGLSYIGVGDFEKAKLEVERALLVPNDPALYYEKLGEINIARGDLDAAKVALERGSAADSGRRSLTLAAVSYFVGNHDQAASQASAAAGEPYADAWSAVIRKAKGDAGGAAAALEAGSATGDQEKICARNFFVGEWAYLDGDKDAARKALQAALATRAYWTLEFAAAKARLANMGG